MGIMERRILAKCKTETLESCCGYYHIHGSGGASHLPMPMSMSMSLPTPNSLQLSMGNGDCSPNSIHISMADHNSPQVGSIHPCSLPENSSNLLHSHMQQPGPPLQLMGHPDNNNNNNNNSMYMMGIGPKREHSLLGNLSRMKRGRDEEGSASTQQQGRPQFRASPSVRISTPPLSPHHVHQTNSNNATNQNGRQFLHQNFPMNIHMNNVSPPCSSIEASPQSPIQKPIPSLQGLQVPPNPNSSPHISTPLQNLQSSPHPSAFHEPCPFPDLASRRAAVRAWGNQPLSVVDPDLWDIMEKEKQRQWKGIELIASENFTCQAVIEALGSHLTNKYSEGMPGARYYGGNEYIDQIESMCCERALAAFHLDPEKWGVNVQPYSCTSANFAVYTALLQPKDRIMGLDSPSGEWDYGRFRQIADKCGAVLMCDMAHISGLIAAQECLSPFDYCDIVTSTTHKSLRGPRGGAIFFRKGPKPRKRGSSLYQGDDNGQYDFEERINFAVFPSLQGGPHNNHIAALAVALKQVATPEYKAYIQQVKKNSQALASALLKRNCRLVTGGTDNHLLLWDLRPLGLTGNRYEKVCEMCHITVNKNAVFGDSGAMAPGGVRIGTPAMTSRGCVEGDFDTIAEFLLKAAQIANNVQKEHGKLQKDFLKGYMKLFKYIMILIN